MSDETEPVRLRDDPDAPEALREDLAAAAGAALPALDLEAGLASLEAAIGAEGGGPSDPGTPGAGGGATGGASLGGGAAMAAGAGAVILALIGGAYLWLASDDGASEAVAARPPAPEAVEPVEVEAAAPAPEPAEPAPTEAVEPEPEPAPEAEPSARPRRGARRAVARRPSSPEPDLREEMELTNRARAALAGRPAEALRLAREGQRRFGDGLFSEEREAIEVLALAALDRADEARPRGERFLRRHPRSTFAERVRRAIAE